MQVQKETVRFEVKFTSGGGIYVPGTTTQTHSSVIVADTYEVQGPLVTFYRKTADGLAPVRTLRVTEIEEIIRLVA